MPKTHTLIHPVTIDGKQITSLSLRHGTLGDMIEVEKKEGLSDTEMTAALLERLSGISSEAALSLSMKDVVALTPIIAELMGNTSEEEGG